MNPRHFRGEFSTGERLEEIHVRGPIGNLGDGEAVWHADMTYSGMEFPSPANDC